MGFFDVRKWMSSLLWTGLVALIAGGILSGCGSNRRTTPVANTSAMSGMQCSQFGCFYTGQQNQGMYPNQQFGGHQARCGYSNQLVQGQEGRPVCRSMRRISTVPLNPHYPLATGEDTMIQVQPGDVVTVQAAGRWGFRGCKIRSRLKGWFTFLSCRDDCAYTNFGATTPLSTNEASYANTNVGLILTDGTRMYEIANGAPVVIQGSGTLRVGFNLPFDQLSPSQSFCGNAQVQLDVQFGS